MKGEINKDFYCSTAGMADCPEKGNCSGCPDYHRKHPTPEQFKEEYGEEWGGAVYFNAFINGNSCYVNGEYRGMPILEAIETAKKLKSYKTVIVCACTPWGKPGNDWRPG
jgi:hypothetical protein